MNRLLIILLWLPFFGLAQGGSGHYALLKNDSLCKPISLPDLRYSEFSIVYKLGEFSSYRYIIREDSIYRKIFSRYPKDSLPFIDFSKQELSAYISCLYCLRINNTDNKPRHRNACMYTALWCLRKKQGV